MKQRRGDINVLRRGVFGRRVDEGLNAEILLSDKTLDKYSQKTQSLDPNGSNRNINLPDATTLDLGWEIVIHHNGTSNSLFVRDNSFNLLKEISFITAANESKIYAFQLINNSNAAGTWIIKELGDNSEDSNNVSYKVTTTDATITEIVSIPTQTNTNKNIEIKIIGKKISGSGIGGVGDGVAFVRHARTKNISNVVTLHHLQSTFTSKDVKQWGIFVDIVGTNLRVRVQGSADNTIDWELVYFEQNL
jgi:hypothetical protein